MSGNRPRYCLSLFLLSLAFGVGCRNERTPEEADPRPITYVTLSATNPGKTSRLTGSVESWKREDISFEVAGRIMRVVEPGAHIVGRTFDEQGNLLTEGTVLAEIDDKRYQIALAQAQAAATAAQTDLEEVIPQQLSQAESALALQQKEFDRYTALVAQQSASKQELDRVEAAYRSAKARVAEVEAMRATKGALLNTALAQVEQAKVNISDCKLYSPFTGQIARVHEIPGGYVLPGKPVVTLQMMDPLKVDIAVSPARDARINYNDLVRVYAPTGDELEGYVYLKDTFADPATRTFLVTLLVRNKQIRVGVPDELEGKGIAECRNLWKLDKPDIAGPGNYYAEVEAIHQDDQGYFVWKVENLTQDQLFEDFDPVLTVRKVRVTPGEGRVPVLQVFTFRELTDYGESDPATDIIAGGITGMVADGDKMLLVRQRWIGRPGDVVGVGLKGEATPRGFYVPQEAIQFDGQKHFLAVAELAGDAHQVVQVPVTPAETVGRLQRIDATSGAQLAEGMKVIVDGAHYVQPQDKVNPVDEIEVSP